MEAPVADQTVQRRLAAIVSADMVGYPRLSSATPAPQRTVFDHAFSGRGHSVQSAALFVGEGHFHHSWHS